MTVPASEGVAQSEDGPETERALTAFTAWTEAAPVTAHGWSYPIWMWSWTTPDDPELRWDQTYQVQLDTTAREAKRTALGRFASQINGPINLAVFSEVLYYLDEDFELLVLRRR